MNPPQTPGVYIQELNAFPSSVVQVATAIPLFIGYTAQAEYNGLNVADKPVKLNSFQDFLNYFGAQPTVKFAVKEARPSSPPASAPFPQPFTKALRLGGKDYVVSIADADPDQLLATRYLLYDCIRLFYSNGGATCYVHSIGTYSDTINKDKIIAAVGAIAYLQDPTMILCPDALGLPEADYNAVVTTMLAQCAHDQSRISILDVYDGYTEGNSNTVETAITNFRTNVGINNLNYGFAYYPWLQTSITSPDDINYTFSDETIWDVLTSVDIAPILATLTSPPDKKALMPATILTQLIQEATVPKADKSTQRTVDQIHKSFHASSPTYKLIIKAIAELLNILPTGPAMAGVYTSVDNSRGVWKAPANVSLNSVTAPMVTLNDTDQNGLNVDALTGKSVNAIRAYAGFGVLVWGARTLEGNSQDWRYINVRRTLIMIEQSIKLMARSYVFEPNDANTWVTMKSSIQNFLYDLWKQGALAGVKPDDAYLVSVGLGSTMTSNDILDGNLRITIQVALVKPAEFIILTFQQLMQKS